MLRNISIIFLITFFLIISLDLLFGGKIINFYYSNNHIVKHPIYHHDFDKNLNKKIIYNNVYEYNICTNLHGFKSSCNDKSKISKFIDFAFIGDSFTEGVGLNYEETFVGKFKNEKSDKQIVNLGVSSYSPKTYYKKIEHLLNQGFIFDRIIIFVDVGDIFDENSYFIKKDKTIGKKSDLKVINIIYQDFGNLYKLKKILKQYLPINFIFYTKINKLKLNFYKDNNILTDEKKIKDSLLINSRWTYKNNFSNKDQRWVKKGTEEAVFYMNKIFELSEVNNFRVSLAVYPWPAQILFDKDTGRPKLGEFWKNYCKNKCENFINYLDYFHELKKEIGKEEIIKLYYIKNDIHFNENGNNIIFQKLMKTF